MEKQLSTSLDLDFLKGGGAMGALIRAYDWNSTPLGSPIQWPQSLKTSIAIMLRSGYPIFVWWGQEMIMFHNDAYLPVLGKKHPEALGKPAVTIWSEIWDQIGPMMDQVLNKGEQIYARDLLFLLGRKGFSEECYFTFSYSPIPNDYGGVGGIFCASNEETPKVLRQRRLKTLKDISELTAPLRSVEEVYETSIRIIAENTHDIPFSLLYILNDDMSEGRLEGHTGFSEEIPEGIESIIQISGRVNMWPFQEVIRTGKSAPAEKFSTGNIKFPGGPWKESPETATVVPVQRAGNDRLAGFLICGISPKLEFDYEYQSYLDLVAGQISTAIANVRAFEEERKRAEALAEIDKAKTVFFSNISHEFRTPLTLMLGPLEEVLNQGNLSVSEKNQLAIVHRNGLRLLKLVNTLLDFSRIEAGRIQARFEPVQLCEITAELSSVFRAAIEKAGMNFVVNCKPLSFPVYVDPVMWERIIFNLLSNAYKFTLQGEVSVQITEKDNHALLIVKDTGTGIPASELPKLFTRFHRIEGSKGRTHEGSGIGLAMVHELVRLHGGEINVESVEGQGTEFTISLPFGKEHLADEMISTDRNISLLSLNILPLADEDFSQHESAVQNNCISERNEAFRLLVVDDNADMRKYLCSLLDKYYSIVACADGQSAYEAAISSSFDLILTDIMMPVLDGIGLLNKLRSNELTKSLPVIFLSARAGDEAKVEGIEAGADDYLVKPFSSKELLARVKTNLEMSRIRKEALVRETMLSEELKASRKRIQSSYETLYTLIMQVPALVCILRGPEHEYELVNPAYQKLFGNRELQGKKIRQALPELHGQGIFELLDEVYRTGKSHVATELEAKLSSDESTPLQQHYFNLIYHPLFDSNSEVEGIFVFAYDVTEEVLARKIARNVNEELERKVKTRTAELLQKNQELKEQKEFIEIILDSSVDLICVYDKETRLVALNRKCEEIFHMKRENVIGKKLTEIIPGSEDTDAHKDLLRALSGELVHNTKFKASVKERYFENFLIPLRNNDNEITAALIIAHDIHESLETAEKLKKFNDELIRKNDELEQFAYVSSHDLQEPLRKIQTFSELTARYLNDQALAEKYLSKINISAARMAALIRDVLNYSRLSKTNEEFIKTDLNEVLENVKTDFELLIAEKNAVVITETPLPSIKGIPLQLHQLFSNIIGNALKFSDKEPVISISGRALSYEEVTANPSLNAGTHYVLIQFTDNGIGFEQQYSDQIFTIFKRLNNHTEYSGTGIGLALCKKIADNHQGIISAVSTPGKGATFNIFFPVH